VNFDSEVIPCVVKFIETNLGHNQRVTLWDAIINNFVFEG